MIQCPYCDKEVKHRRNLIMHIDAHHPDKLQEYLLARQKAGPTCPECGSYKVRQLNPFDTLEKCALGRGYTHVCNECEEVFAHANIA